MQKGYGYKPITDKDKELILGLNAARVYGINVEQTMKQLAQDTISNVRAAIAPKMTEEFRKYAAAAGMKLAERRNQEPPCARRAGARQAPAAAKTAERLLPLYENA